MILQPVRVRYADGQADTFGMLVDAKSHIEGVYPHAFYVENADRILVWESEDAAYPDGHGDDGSKAVCEIVEDSGDAEED